MKLFTAASLFGAVSAESWKLLMSHDSRTGEYFPNNADVNIGTWKSKSGKLFVDLAQDYSQFRDDDGKMTLKLVYPELSHDTLTWKQSASPLSPHGTDLGFEIKANQKHDWNGADDFKGLSRSSTSATLLDGQPEHGYWFYAVGAHRAWGGHNKFPGPRGTGHSADNFRVSQVQLWVKNVEPECAASNCYKWTCEQWCKCYVEDDLSVYEATPGCQDDNDQACICEDVPKPEAPTKDDEWVLLVKHDSSKGEFFPTNAQTSKGSWRSASGDLILDLDQDYNSFKGADGKMTFQLRYPLLEDKTLTWKQSSSPLAPHGKVTGYEIQANQAHDFDGNGDFKGICRSRHPTHTLIDGQPEHSNWYYAIGAHRNWYGSKTFPGPRGSQRRSHPAYLSATTHMELWVKKVTTKWVLLAKHDSSKGEYFPRSASVEKGSFISDSGNLVLNLNQDYNNFKGTDGKFTLQLRYPELSHDTLTWKQSASPLSPHGTDLGFEIKANQKHDWNGADDFKGLSRSSTGATLLDGQPEHGYWFYAVGAHQAWGAHNKFPGPRGTGHSANNYKVGRVELWVLKA